MLRLGLQLTLHSGREALVRLLITAAAVAVGVALLLGVLAEFHAFQANASKQCWSCTQGASVPATLPAHGELWNNSVDFYQGQTISRLDVAALGPDAPVPPGITHLPPPGDYYASPALAGAALVGTQYFESDLTPILAGYAAMLVGVPIAAAVAALVSLRRVQISPLGVTRRAKPKPPTFWRVIALLIGVGVYIYGLDKTSKESIGAPSYPGLLLTMIGLLIAGPWLTAQAARLFGRLARGSSALLAARRIADNPKGAFRAVTGLTLAVFLGTMVGVILPALNSIQATPTAGTLSNILKGQVGLPTAAGQRLISGLRAIPGAAVYPLYDLWQGAEPRTVAVSCADMRVIGGLGECAPGLRAVQVQDDSIFDDNPRFGDKPIVDSASPAYTGNLTALPLQTVLVKVNSPATLERVRTYLAVHAPPQVGGNANNSPTPPQTFGETLQIRTARAATFEKIVYAAIALTLIVAGCSLAVSVGGGLVGRKRPFTLLRVGGTPVGVLSRVVLFEAAVPLVAATLVAAAIAYGTTLMAFLRLAPDGTAVPQLGRDYFTIMGIGLVIAFAVITVTLPLLRRMTAPSTVRFE
jgi:FtsX-like permease family